MRIYFVRTGGFAGRRLEGSLDSSAMPGPQARRLNELVKESRFFDLPPLLQSNTPGADQFNYKVTVEADERTHTVEAGEAAIPGSMRPFLDFLARSVQKK